MRRAGKLLLWTIVVVVAALVVGCVALWRPDIPYAKLDAKYASPASRWLDLADGVRVHYRDEGLQNGPPIVMVHGFSASLQAWEPWVRRLGDRWRTITLDLPGHGLTRAPAGYAASIDGDADLVDAVARRLGAAPYVIVGNSMGGAVAWDEALRHPADVRALVLVDAAGLDSRRGGGEPLIFKLIRQPWARGLIEDLDMRPLVKQGLEAAYLDERLVTPALVDRYVELSRAPGHRDILLTLQQRTRTPPSPAALGSIRVPTLVMHGENDKLIPAADGRAFAAAIPGARLITYPGVGHVPMEQIPDRSAADLRAFLLALGLK